METDFSDWLRSKLKEKRWSQAELARKSGVSAPQITRALSGERGLGEQSINGIASALDVPPEDIYRMVGILPPERKTDPLDNEMAYLFGLLPMSEKHQVLDYVRFMVEKVKIK